MNELIRPYEEAFARYDGFSPTQKNTLDILRTIAQTHAENTYGKKSNSGNVLYTLPYRIESCIEAVFAVAVGKTFKLIRVAYDNYNQDLHADQWSGAPTVQECGSVKMEIPESDLEKIVESYNPKGTSEQVD